MEFKLTEALQKGIEAHKAGNAQEADRYYTAILKAQPKHSDANHNMGILAVGLGKVEAALPFFKTALEANSKITQYWLSYIDALIKLNRFDDARAVFHQAKNKGKKGDGFDQLGEQLKVSDEDNPTDNKSEQDPSEYQLEYLVKLYNKGQLQQMLTDASLLISQFPKSITLSFMMGAAYQGLGNLGLAVEFYQKVISIKPDHVDAYNNMGTALKIQGKLEEAIEAFKKALVLKPDFAEVYINMGNALKEQGNLDDAIKAYIKAFSIKSNSAEAYGNMGIALIAQGKLEEAIEALNKALSIKPDYADAHYNIGIALQATGKLEEAVEAYKKALMVKPDYAEVYCNMGVALKEQGRLGEAIEFYRKALLIKPDYAEAHNNIGNALQDQGKLEKAVESYKKALLLKPDYAEAYSNMGAALADYGKLDKAIEVFNKALSISPHYSEAHRSLSIINKYNIDDPHFAQVKNMFQDKTLNKEARCNLCFALAKMYEDVGDLDQAFSHLSEGNALRKQLLNYSIRHDENLFLHLKDTQPELQKNSLELEKNLKVFTPILIVGMLRSGTTLIEQIVSSHTEVNGAGELEYAAHHGMNLATGKKVPSKENLIEFREMYLSELTKLSSGKLFVTDKMPQNFRLVPLLCAALPEAKIIHVQRDPRATCWSNFKHYFTSKSHGYSYNLVDTAKYYGLYLDLMQFWDQRYGNRIYNLDYDKLTEDQEQETRRLVEYLELNWEDACLSPHKNKRSVRTASQQQVREKVYRGSSEAWRDYEQYLDGAFDSLGSL